MKQTWQRRQAWQTMAPRGPFWIDTTRILKRGLSRREVISSEKPQKWSKASPCTQINRLWRIKMTVLPQARASSLPDDPFFWRKWKGCNSHRPSSRLATPIISLRTVEDTWRLRTSKHLQWSMRTLLWTHRIAVRKIRWFHSLNSASSRPQKGKRRQKVED